MIREYFNIFATPGDHQQLVYHGETSHGRWTDGELVAKGQDVRYPVRNGIPSFARPHQDSWGDAQAVDRELERHGGKRAGLIAKNVADMIDGWGPAQQRFPWIDRIVQHGGLILEIACGWGGGNAPLILANNPAARILMNDLGAVILDEWRRYISAGPRWPNIGLAHFDATDCPIGTGVFDVVSSSGGIANIPGSTKAIREAYRILKPGGRLFMSDIDLDPDSFSRLPAAAQEKWRRESDPDVGAGYEHRLTDAGFIIKSSDSRKSVLDPHESTIAEIAAQHGMTMSVIGFSIEAAKE